MRSILNYFTKTEIFIWCFSMVFITISFMLFDKENYLTLTASLIGTTALIFSAKGNPIGQILIIIFSIIYAIISYNFSYYGEVITYLGMTATMSVFSLISWINNPYQGNKSEVEINSINKKEIISMSITTIILTFVFYYILKYFNTTNLIMSTISVMTSFFASYLTLKRSEYYALAYAVNDIILIILWIFATLANITYLSVVICFAMFLINDIYGFINWSRIKKRQLATVNS